MKDIKQFIKSNKTDEEKLKDYTSKEYYLEKVRVSNSIEGDMNKDDGYNCPKCKNKGVIYELSEQGNLFYEVAVKCECMKIRMSIRSLKNSGLSEDVLNKSSFKNYKATKDWQKQLLQKIKLYLEQVKEKKYWFYLSGVTGSGKTMLLTALFKKLVLEYHLTGSYMLWNNEAKQLITEAKRFTDDYKDRIYDLTTCDVLYIDDFLKLGTSKDNAELSLAYEIINNRYQSNRITLISSEVVSTELEKLDSAIFGRVFEKTNRSQFLVSLIGDDKNYRLNGGEEL